MVLELRQKEMRVPVSVAVSPPQFPLKSYRSHRMRWRWPWRRWNADSPQSGGPMPHSVGNEFPPPHSVGEPSPHCGENLSQRAGRALDGLELAWRQRAEERSPDDAWNPDGVEELAIEFRRQLQALPHLCGARLNSRWVRQRYPLF